MSRVRLPLPRRARGFTIIELMVAMTLSLILMAGALSILYTSKLSYNENDRLARIQEAGRAAVELLLRDARSAGYQGCSRNVTVNFFNRLNNSNTLLWNFAQPVFGFEATGGAWSPTLDPLITGALADSDVLVLRTSRQGWPVFRSNGPVTDPTLALNVDRPSLATTLPAARLPLMISDCENAAVFTATTFTGGGTAADPTATIAHAAGGGPPTNSDTSVGSTFQAGAQVIPVQTIIYYVGQNAQVTRPTLWQQVGNEAPQPMIEGVERMQLLYGLDTNGDLIVDQYVKASAVGTRWNAVIAINIALLIRSEDQVNTDLDTRTYTMLDEVAGPFNDRRQRSLFTTTVTLRNRAI